MSELISESISESKKYSVFSIWLWILIITVIRVIYIFLNQRPLGIDEAQYWTWSQHLALGYHSKSPLIAWAIRLATELNGVNIFAIRFLSPVTYGISGLMVYFSAERLFKNNKTAFYSALIFILMPGVSFSSSIISTDPFLILFWSIALFNFIESIQKNKISYWLTCGVAIGLGILSKYTMLICVFSFALSLIFLERKYLKQKGPYWALLVSFLIFIPNILWNLNNHWATFSHVGVHNLDWSEAGVHFGSLFNFIFSQFAIAGPLVFAFFLFALTRFEQLKKHPEAYGLLIFQIAPLFIGMMIEACVAHAYANWAAPIYLAVSIFVAGEMLEKKSLETIKTRLLILSMVINGLLALGLYVYELSYQNKIYLSSKDPFYLNRPWPILGHALMPLRLMNFDGNYLFDDRAILSELMFYLRLDFDQVYSFNAKQDPADQYDLLTQLKTGQNYILITRHKNSEILKNFDQNNLIDTVDIFSDHQINIFYVYDLKGFKGYGK